MKQQKNANASSVVMEYQFGGKVGTENLKRQRIVRRIVMWGK